MVFWRGRTFQVGIGFVTCVSNRCQRLLVCLRYAMMEDVASGLKASIDNSFLDFDE